jgi:polysaccharide deacetylase 2 family uncharacterized protein YibQ
VIGFLRGIIFGGVVAVAGLAAVSQLTVPLAPSSPADRAEPAIPTTAADARLPAGETAPQDMSPDPEPATRPSPPLVQSDAPLASGARQSATEGELALAPAAESPKTPTVSGPSAPDLALLGDTPATAAPPPFEPPAQPPTTAPEARQGSAEADTSHSTKSVVTPAPIAPVPAAPAVPQSEAVPNPVDQPPLPPVDDVFSQPAPEPARGPSNALDHTATLLPTPGLGDQAQGVVTGRLPRISDPGRGTLSAGAVTDGFGVTALAPVADLPPLQRFARDFAGAQGKPMFAVLLEDGGDGVLNRQALAALSLPLTIVIDPLSDGAAERAAIWRAGGQEVVMAANGVPSGATASDLEQTFQALADALPQAVAVLDPDGATFQDNRPLAAQVVPIVAGQGRGLVTFDQGLNAADQVARRVNLGRTVIFRRIDAAGGDAVAIGRHLDRAAFKAAQDGRVAVIGTLRPDTVAAILEWASGGKSATVTLAPVSALMAGAGN